MLARRKERLAAIHIARKQTCPDDAAYRALLEGSAGVSSASDIETDEQFQAVMAAFTALGFIYGKSTRKKLPVRDDQQGTLCTERQLYYIKGLWELASRAKDERSLRAIVKRIGHVDDLRFLKMSAASAVILALRDICWKSGFNPDGPVSISKGMK